MAMSRIRAEMSVEAMPIQLTEYERDGADSVLHHSHALVIKQWFAAVLK